MSEKVQCGGRDRKAPAALLPFPPSSLVLIKYIACALLIAKQELGAQAETVSSELMVTGEFYQGAGQEEAKTGGEESPLRCSEI